MVFVLFFFNFHINSCSLNNCYCLKNIREMTEIRGAIMKNIHMFFDWLVLTLDGDMRRAKGSNHAYARSAK